MSETVETTATSTQSLGEVLIEEVGALSIKKDIIETEKQTEDSLDLKQKKKLDKLIDSILKKTNSKSQQAISLEEKYYALAQKLVESQEQNKKLQLNAKETEKQITNIGKQRDQMQSEFGKQLLVKEKLESLCRELQRQNKLVKEESIQRIEDEEKKRKEISVKFQSAIDEINQQVSSNSEKNNSLIQENVQLTTKLKNLIEQYEAREQQIEKVLKHKDLEVQLANAKLQQGELKLAEITERSKKEKAIYENHCVELTKKCEFHQEAEKQLRSQLALYTQKYEEFQSTLTKSNQVFESFKAEMEKMTKKIKKQEQEINQWKGKCDTSDKASQFLIKQKDELEEKCKKIQSKADIMEQLSRSLQTERNTLKQQNKDLEEKLKATLGSDTQSSSGEIHSIEEKCETKIDANTNINAPVLNSECVQEEPVASN